MNWDIPQYSSYIVDITAVDSDVDSEYTDSSESESSGAPAQVEIKSSGSELKIKAQKVYIQASKKEQRKEAKIKKRPTAAVELYPITLNFESELDGNVKIRSEIRGAKYQQNAKLEIGNEVFPTRRLRDLHDSNCIEILNSKEERFGFLPREYSRIVSPLIEQHYMRLLESEAISETEIEMVFELSDKAKSKQEALKSKLQYLSSLNINK